MVFEMAEQRSEAVPKMASQIILTVDVQPVYQ